MPIQPVRFASPEINALVKEATHSAAERLSELCSDVNKVTAKEARKALFLLQQRGIGVGISPTRTFSAPSLPDASIPHLTHAWITSVSPAGNELLIFGLQSGQGNKMLSVRFQCWNGNRVARVHSDKISLQELTSSVLAVNSEMDVITECPVDLALERLAQIESEAKANRETFPQGYKDAIRHLGPLPAADDQPLVYRYLNKDEIAKDPSIGHDPEAVFEHKGLVGMLVSENILMQTIEKVLEQGKSPIELTDAQRKQRTHEIIEKECITHLGSSYAQLARRLERTALALQLSGAEDAAKQVIYHVTSCPSSADMAWPFATELLKRSIGFFMAMAQREQEAEGR